MAPRRQSAPARSLSGYIIPVAIAGAGAAAYYGYPAVAALWLGLFLISWTEPPAVLSGKSKTSAYPVAANEGEAAAYKRYRFWNDMKFKLFLPNADWLPGFPVLASFLAASIAAFAAYFIPVSDPYTGEYGQWINVAAAYIGIMQYCAASRKTAAEGDVSPGVRINSLLPLAKKKPTVFTALLTLGFVTGSAAAIAGMIYLPLVAEVPTVALWAVCLTAFPLAAFSKIWIEEALGEWRGVVNARGAWTHRWNSIKVDPAPRLMKHEYIGNATVDTFDAPSGTSAQTFLDLAVKIETTIGAGMKVAVLETPNFLANGEAIPGSMHPNRFQVVTWASDGMPDVTDSSIPLAHITIAVRSAMAWSSAGMGLGLPILDEIELISGQPVNESVDEVPTGKIEVEDPVTGTMMKVKAEYVQPKKDESTEPGSPAVWKTTWHQGTGPGMKVLREQALGNLSGNLNASVVIDERWNGRQGVIVFGALEDPEVEYDPESGIAAEDVQNLLLEDKWKLRWFNALKQGANPPRINHGTYLKDTLSNGATIHRQPFLVADGFTPSDYFDLAPKLATTLGAAPFVFVGAFSAGDKGSGRKGERHAQAFAVYWSDKQIPASPKNLVPAAGYATKWILSGQIGNAFRAAKMEMPEVIEVNALSSGKSREHLWKIDLRLYGKVNLGTVRSAVENLKLVLGVPYLRVTDFADGCTLVVGADPSQVTLLNPTRDNAYLTDLDWQNAFLSAKVVNTQGILPKLVASSTVPSNEQVQILDFELPSGLEFAQVKSAKAKLTTATGNAFIEVGKVPDEPSKVRLMVSEANPMPKSAPYDWDRIDASKGFPFATGIEGESVEYNPKDDPHLLVVGSSGSGKSVILQTLIYGAIIRDCEIYIGDPVKGGADFQFAIPYSKAVTGDLTETSRMMKIIYAEVVRRKNLNVEYGKGSYRDLPEDIRPKHVVVVLDEFTSLVSPEMVPKPSDDPDLEDERNEILVRNAAKSYIGMTAGKLVREARSAGVTVILATQKMEQDLMKQFGGADLKANMTKILAGKTSQGDRMSALKEWESAPELGDDAPAGRSLFESKITACKVVQAWYEPGEQATLSQKLDERCDPIDPSEKVDLSASAAKSAKQSKVPAQPQVIDLGEVEFSLSDFENMLAEEGMGAIMVDNSDQIMGCEFPEAQPAVPDVEEISLDDDFFGLPEEVQEELSALMDDDEDDLVVEPSDFESIEPSDFQEESVVVPVESVKVAATTPIEAILTPAQTPARSRRRSLGSLADSEGDENPFGGSRRRRAALEDDNPFA
jgi:hypothetical protein